MKLKPHPFARNESSDSFIPFAKHSIRNIAKRELRRAFRDMELCSGLKNKRGWGCRDDRRSRGLITGDLYRVESRGSISAWRWHRRCDHNREHGSHRRIDPGRSLPLLSPSLSLLSSALVCLSSTHYWMCWIPLLQLPIVLWTNCCKLKLALLHSIRVQVSWFIGFDCWIS